MEERFFHGLRRNLVEDHALMRLVLKLSGLYQVPGNRFALSIRVSREVDLFRLFGRLLDILHDLALVLGNEVVGRKVSFDVHAKLALWQVAHMADRGAYIVLVPEDAL